MNVATTEQKQTRADRRITNSEIKTARTCARKHHLSYRLGLRPVDPGKALRFGAAFHEALDARAQTIMRGETQTDALAAAIQTALGTFDRHAPTETDELYPEYILQRTQLIALLNVYHWRWSNEDQNLTVLASEQQFNIPIINPATGRASRTYTLGGKIDKIVRLYDGRLAVMEHKTAGQDISPEADYWKRLRIDQQISLYYMAAQHLGYEIDTVLYDVARKPATSLATITQGRTKKLLTEGVYTAKGDDGEVELGFLDTQKIVHEGEGSTPTGVWLDGEYAEVIPGKQGFSIRETPGLYAMRCNHDLYTQHERHFQRREIPRNEHDLDEARYELWREAQRMRENEKSGVFPRNDSACIGFGKCPYFDLCTTGQIPDSEYAPEGFYWANRVHQELEEE